MVQLRSIAAEALKETFLAKMLMNGKALSAVVSLRWTKWKEVEYLQLHSSLRHLRDLENQLPEMPSPE
jgi:hypothetical protein